MSDRRRGGGGSKEGKKNYTNYQKPRDKKTLQSIKIECSLKKKKTAKKELLDIKEPENRNKKSSRKWLSETEDVSQKVE